MIFVLTDLLHNLTSYAENIWHHLHGLKDEFHVHQLYDPWIKAALPETASILDRLSQFPWKV